MTHSLTDVALLQPKHAIIGADIAGRVRSPFHRRYGVLS